MFRRLFLPLLLSTLLTATHALTNFDDWDHGRVALEKVSIHFRYAGQGPPLLLVHGNPQHSLTWRIIGPILAEKFTVIAPDNRGAGSSSIPPDGNYTAAASAEDLKLLLDHLNITSTYVFSHDKGVGPAVALAAAYPGLVKRLGVSEYLLPEFGYEGAAAPGPWLDLYGNWQLAFFSVPDAAEYFIRGREREMLMWFFYHGSYSGPEAFPSEIIDRYAASISKPGFLRAVFGNYENKIVAEDAKFFRGHLGATPLDIPTLAMGGEASMAQPFLTMIWQNVTLPIRLEMDVVPKAGHWIADENPKWVAERVKRFLDADDEGQKPAVVDLGWLKDRVTLTVGFYGTLQNAALAGLSV
ncbi:putative soluble epoxide hydrolase [Podospora australis]|uniref:Soluble epoxide hydrolase n=1 Tax=Podospora australis TaxID=1536484 RepID=A0AAN7ADV9_9PEZI|nr:putative soluble epoxide hydrolase [Podospora australis]